MVVVLENSVAERKRQIMPLSVESIFLGIKSPMRGHSIRNLRIVIKMVA